MSVPLPCQRMSCECAFAKPENVMCLYQARECHVSVPLPCQRMSCECAFAKPDNVMCASLPSQRMSCVFTKPENVMCLYQARECHVSLQKPENAMCHFTKPENVMCVYLYQATEHHLIVPLPSHRMSCGHTFTKPELCALTNTQSNVDKQTNTEMKSRLDRYKKNMPSHP